MNAYLNWLQNLPLSVWVAESESLWAYPLMLFLHALGMGLAAGVVFALGVMLIGGTARPSAVRVVVKIFWLGFWIHFVSGTLLFAAAATRPGHNVAYYVKLTLIAVGLLLLTRLRRTINGSAPPATRTRITTLA